MKTIKKAVQVACVAAVAVVLASCGGASKPPEWTYEKASITVRMKGDNKLNLYQNKSHTLLVCMYQLRDPNSFNQMLETNDDMSKLLECGRYDGSVTIAKRFVMQPGQEVTEVLDRADGARYIGFIAGYYNLKKDKVSRLYSVPLSGSKPQPINVDLILGPQEIQEMKER